MAGSQVRCQSIPCGIAASRRCLDATPALGFTSTLSFSWSPQLILVSVGQPRGGRGAVLAPCVHPAALWLSRKGTSWNPPPKTPSFYRSLPSAGYGIVALGKRGGVFVRVWCWGDTPCAVLDTTFQPHGCAGHVPFAALSKFSPACGVPALGTSPAF